MAAVRQAAGATHLCWACSSRGPRGPAPALGPRPPWHLGVEGRGGRCSPQPLGMATRPVQCPERLATRPPEALRPGVPVVLALLLRVPGQLLARPGHSGRPRSWVSVGHALWLLLACGKRGFRVVPLRQHLLRAGILGLRPPFSAPPCPSSPPATSDLEVASSGTFPQSSALSAFPVRSVFPAVQVERVLLQPQVPWLRAVVTSTPCRAPGRLVHFPAVQCPLGSHSGLFPY